MYPQNIYKFLFSPPPIFPCFNQHGKTLTDIFYSHFEQFAMFVVVKLYARLAH